MSQLCFLLTQDNVLTPWALGHSSGVVEEGEGRVWGRVAEASEEVDSWALSILQAHCPRVSPHLFLHVYYLCAGIKKEVPYFLCLSETGRGKAGTQGWEEERGECP